jgi:hypothetical protein
MIGTRDERHLVAGRRTPGRHQISLMPGIVVGRIQLPGRLKLSIGGGYQLAVSPNTIREPLTPQFRNNFILTTRLSF